MVLIDVNRSKEHFKKSQSENLMMNFSSVLLINLQKTAS